MMAFGPRRPCDQGRRSDPDRRSDLGGRSDVNHRSDLGRRTGRVRSALLLAAGLGAGFAGGRITRARGPVGRAPGGALAAVGAGAEPTDPVSPLRFGDQPDLLATEDAASPPFEGLSANTRFANEVLGADMSD
ncbi:hypothetical protein ACG83_36540 [Frankia sp. R43]|nr:hypothetical protein ACG83_36540 [Frankia sp. R43]